MPITNPYDDVLYAGSPFSQTHPDRLATLARLFGMNPAPIERCRVLELGCGDGGNLIPMAYTLPGSQFVGVDMAARGIALGREMAGALSLPNVRLHCLDILQAGEDFGRFDYIIAQGVYSWVPAAVRERMLAICRESLNPHGVAYISYSAYPGAHVRKMLAEMLQYHAHRYGQPEQQIQQAQALLGFLAMARPPQDAYSLLLRQELESLAVRRPQSLFHDELAECAPAYFRDFIARAAQHELQYLGEADFFEMQDAAEAPEVSAVLRKFTPDPIEREQYLDFLKCRRFRQTLLCHTGIPLKRRIDSAQMREFYIAAAHSRGETPPQMPTDHPAAQAAMAALAEAWPAALSFPALLDAVRADDELLLADIVLACYACGLFQLRVHPPQFAASVSEFPRASALARHQAARASHVTNLCHESIHIQDELCRRLLIALDGTRNHASLLAELRAATNAEPVLDRDLDVSLQRLAKLALLEA